MLVVTFDIWPQNFEYWMGFSLQVGYWYERLDQIENSFRNGPNISEPSSNVLQLKTQLLPKTTDNVQKHAEISFTSIFIAEECLEQFIFFNVKMSQGFFINAEKFLCY
jgi:hypothetical protein